MKYIIWCEEYDEYVKSITFTGAKTTNYSDEAKVFSDLDVAEWVCDKMCDATGGARWDVFEVED